MFKVTQPVTLKDQIKYYIFKHPFHIVERSPWPFMIAWFIFFFLLIVVVCLHYNVLLVPQVTIFFNNLDMNIFWINAIHKCNPIRLSFVLFMFFFQFLYFWQSYFLIILFSFVLYFLLNWWSDVAYESKKGYHTLYVQKGLEWGMILFIITEIMFFFTFFWATFHSSLSPAIQIGTEWPPLGITPVYVWGVPLINTLLLLLSAIVATWAHKLLIFGKKTFNQVFFGLTLTIFLGITFLFIQLQEYSSAQFSIGDTVYGSIFYMLTGFHGFHVFVGLTFLSVCLYRFKRYQFSRTHHKGLEFALMYWHFVDVVWIFLFFVIYVGSYF